jgi:hypothetical protein
MVIEMILGIQQHIQSLVFLSETGVQSLPSLDTWYEVTKNTSDLDIDSDFVQYREHSNGQIVNLM